MMARISCTCEHCRSKFDVSYLFIKPGKIKCPACGSYRTKEEAGSNSNCGCSQNTRERPPRFT